MNNSLFKEYYIMVGSLTFEQFISLYGTFVQLCRYMYANSVKTEVLVCIISRQTEVQDLGIC